MRRIKDFLLRYGVSVAILLVAFLITKLLWPAIQPSPVPMFFAGILVAFWVGLGPSIFTSIAAALTTDFFFVPPYDHFEWTTPNLVRMGVFIAVSSLVSWLNSTRKKLIEERGSLLTKIESFNEELRHEVETATHELSQTNEALLRTQQHLGRSERLAVVGQMAASLAHEVGTPLNAISGHLELLSATKSHDTETRRRIRIIRQQVESIVGTVRRLVEWTHKRNVIFESVDIENLINQILGLVGPTLDQHKIEASLVVEDRLPAVEGNREGLQQVFLNLINNSIDAMPAGGKITIVTRLNRSDDKAAEILFQDTGGGIRSQDAEHLFEPMWTTKPSGGGFGLAIVRETMAEHNGEIEVISEQPVGAGFRLTMPLTQPQAISAEEVLSHVA